MRHTFLSVAAAAALLIAGSAWAPEAAAQAASSSRIEMAQAGQMGGAKVRVKSAILRSSPDVKSKKLTSLRRGTKIQVVGSQGDWSHVRVGKREGYVMSSLLTM